MSDATTINETQSSAATLSSQDAPDENLTKEQWVEKSWEFLTIITDRVEKLPPDVQAQITEAGRQFSKAGASYNHDDKKPYRPPASPAKVAMLNELKKQSAEAK